jgi:anti-sigma B factor antagonist
MTAEGFQVQAEVVDSSEAVILTLAGQLDAHTFDRLEACVREVFESGRFNLILEVSGVDYLSSAGVGVLFSSLTCARESGGNVVLLNMSPAVAEVVNALGMAQMFTIATDREAALHSFNY